MLEVTLPAFSPHGIRSKVRSLKGTRRAKRLFILAPLYSFICRLHHDHTDVQGHLLLWSHKAFYYLINTHMVLTMCRHCSKYFIVLMHFTL